MDDAQLKEILTSQWRLVPKDIRSLIVAEDLSPKIEWIGRKYNLSSEHIALLENEVLFVLFGLVHMMDFAQNIETELGLQKEQARLVTQEIGMQIFSEVKNSLRELSKSLEVENPTTPTPVPTSPPIATVQGVQMQKENTTPETQDSIQTAQANATKSEGILGRGIVEEVSLPSKDVLLKEIEHPALIGQNTEHELTLIDKKLSGIVKAPREEVRVNMAGYKGVDPYREPAE